MTSTTPARRAPTLLAAGILLLAPLLLLGPCLLGGRTFVPFDLAQFPPVRTKLTAAELERVTAGQNGDVTEVPITFLPEWRFARQELEQGRLPHWNPYARRGVPLLATAVVGFLYPPNWLLLLPEDPAGGLAAGAYLSLAVAGLLAFGLLRALGLGTLAALFGALAFAFSGTLFANAHFYQRLAALVWLPGMLWAMLRIAEPRRGRGGLAVAALALCTGATWLAGFPPYAAAATLVAGLWAAFLLARALRASGARPASGLALRIAAGVALGFGIAAVQLAPMFAFFPESNRSVAPGLDQLAAQTFDWAGLLGYAMPDPFGHPGSTTELPYDRSPLAFWLFAQESWEQDGLLLPHYNYTEFTVFPGTLTLVLALAGILARGVRFRWFALLAGALLLVLAEGSLVVPLYELPGLRNVPPVRFIAPVCLLCAALAAIGLQSLVDARGRRRWYALAGACGLAAAGFLAGSLWLSAHPPADAWSAVRGAVFAAYRTSPAVVDLTPEKVDAFLGRYLAPGHRQLLDNLRYAAIAFAAAAVWLGLVPLARRRGAVAGLAGLALAATLAQQLVLAHRVSGGRELPFAHETPVHAFLRAQRERLADRGGFAVARGDRAPSLAVALPPCTLVPERIRDVNIYTFTDKRAHLPFAELYGPAQLQRGYWVNALPDDERLRRPLFDLLGVRYVLSSVPLQHAGEKVGPEWRGPQGEFFVYRRPGALPRAFVVPAVELLPGEDAVVERLIAPDFDPLRAALVTPDQHAALARALGGAPAAGPPEAAQRAVRFVRDVPTEVMVSVGAGPPGYLVLTDTFLPGWTATAGGGAVPMVRCDLNVRLVPLPADAIEVTFRYSTPWLAPGAAITASALLALALLLLVSRRRRVPDRPAPPLRQDE